ncbi:uncharacterized protein LTR77_000242 [Saxophila tyrrhenica]|uniref:Zn(2)-C6 fungal-type domain-containing protein n=1 Tax=Saxophila tyrrhenica TaxID=1690608 RepID=A0AAV9PQQ9_9PEZI|nr:hypothetical protein LTR77_000242 [Saxophila tyrrhenica]
MAEAITIPSPSVFLRASPPPPNDPPASSQPNAPKQPNGRRPGSAEGKKKAAPRKPGASALSSGGGGSGGGGAADGAAVIKPKQSKSRNGCLTCKAKRLKCGEEKPGCQQCARRNVVCGGYRKDYKWRPFEETNVKQHIERHKRGLSPKQSAVSGQSSKAGSPELGGSKPIVDPPRSDDANKKRDSVLNEGSPQPRAVDARPAKAKRTQPPPSNKKGKEPVPSIEEDFEPPQDPRSRTESPEQAQQPAGGPPDLLPGALSHFTPALGLSPTLTEILLPFDPSSHPHPDLANLSLPSGFQNMMTPMNPMLDPDLDDEEINFDDVVEIDSDGEPMNNQQMAVRSRRAQTMPLASTGSPDDGMSPTMNYIYPQPFVAEGSPEMLTFRFDRLTCGILSIMDGPHENPWRMLIWPLTSQSPGLYHAISAMTAFHSAGEIPGLRLVGHEHKAASIRYIQEGIRDNSMGDQTAIATALALGFAESWDQPTVTGNTHIKGAQALVRRAMQRHRRSPLVGDDLARLKFLINAWVYMDVIARLTCVDSDESNDFDNTFIFSDTPNECPSMVMGSPNGGFGIDFGMPVDARLDPLMGCANTLFPLIGRVANLVRRVCRSTSNSPVIIDQAHVLKVALEAWDPPAFIERPEDPTTDVQHTLQTAEAYRWATLLHLHSAVPELPSLTSTELAQRVLQYLATVPLASRTVIVQIYPLMVAGCEIPFDEDRNWVRTRWAAMNQRMRIGIIEKAATLTEEVWRRRENYEAQPPSNRKLVATKELQPQRGRGQPLVRSPTGSMRPGDPGRTGMVFSYVEGDGDGGDQSPPDEDEKRRRARQRRFGRDPRMSISDPAYTVRGHLHWVGVMWDWGWESRLSQ